MEIKNLKEAALRIKRAAKANQRIILYGDSDLDGISSVVILRDAIKTLGGDNIRVYFPNREKEGYGLNDKAVKKFEKEKGALLITMDCGISSFLQIKKAREIGIEVVVLDHHEILEKIPDANIVVDPKQPGDDYPFKGFSSGSLCYKVVEAVLGENLSLHLKNNFAELAALSIISDMMPQEEDNAAILEDGLLSLPKTFRPFLSSFQDYIFEKNKQEGLKLQSIKEIAQIIISALNSGEINSRNIHDSYEALLSQDSQKAKLWVRTLIEKGQKKQERIQEITRDVEMLAERKKFENIVFEGRDEWEGALLGAVASRVCNNFQKPVFIYKKMDKDSMGSVRMPRGFNAVDAMKSCEDLLNSFGGHPMAAGFNVPNKNIEKFKERLMQYFLITN